MTMTLEEVFEFKARVYYEGGTPTSISDDRLLYYFSESRVEMEIWYTYQLVK